MTYRQDGSEDRSVLVIGLSGNVIGIDPASGAALWEHKLRMGSEIELVVQGNRVFACSYRTLACIDYPSGHLVGQVEIDTKHPGRATMLLEGDRLFVATHGELFAFTLDGKQLWKQPLKGKGIGCISLGFPGNVRQADDTGNS